MNEQKNKFNYEYLIGLIASFIPLFLITEDSDKGIFVFSAIILILNLFLFIKIRCKSIQALMNLIFSSLTLATSIWLFLHCLFVKYAASQEFIVWLTLHSKGMVVFNSGAFAFFMAALALFIVTLFEVFQSQ